MYDTHMSTPGNTAKLGTAHSNIQTARSNPSLVGNELTMHSSAYYRVSTLTHYASQALISPLNTLITASNTLFFSGAFASPLSPTSTMSLLEVLKTLTFQLQQPLCSSENIQFSYDNICITLILQVWFSKFFLQSILVNLIY